MDPGEGVRVISEVVPRMWTNRGGSSSLSICRSGSCKSQPMIDDNIVFDATRVMAVINLTLAVVSMLSGHPGTIERREIVEGLNEGE